MNRNTLEILRDPKDGNLLEFIEESNKTGEAAEYLKNPITNIRYEIVKEIPILFNSEDLFGENLKYQKFYDKIAFIYNILNRIYYVLRHGVNYQSEAIHRKHILEEIEIAPSDKVLEVAVGPGINFKFLPNTASYYGIDISLGMLKACRRNLKKWNKKGELFQALAENLPFRDGVFDVVYHVGGFNFFNDRQKAVKEMIRVSKPGAKIVIVDETVQSEEKAYEAVPVINKIYKGKEKIFSLPIDLIPEGMEEIKVKKLCNGVLYSLSFKVPDFK